MIGVAMISPLDAFSNSTIVFTMPAPGIYYDRLGNPQAGYQNLPFRAFLKELPSNVATKYRDYPGVDQTALALEGYTTSPLTMPMNIAVNCWYQCQTGVASGWFYLKPFGKFGRGGIDLMVEAEIGTAIAGFFQIGRGS